jgi:hypothetical protein
VHLIAPDAFAPSNQGVRQFGYGDTELGVKCRFVQEADATPQIGIFPLVELPTGDSDRGLGSGRTQVFLPVWLQKSFGSWTSYGGGGYWINPGPENRDYWFAGWLIQKQVSKSLTIGTEVYHEGTHTSGGRATSQVNVGITWDLTDDYHILASGGPSIQGQTGYQTYLAFQLTFGPKK